MAIDVTVGGANANSYASVAEGDAYHALRLNSGSWTGALPATKESALVMATRLLDAMPAAWTGAAADGVQALRWPRSGMRTRNEFPIAANILPSALKDAVAEFARQLIEADRTGDDDVSNQRITNAKVGSLSVTFDQSTKQEDEQDKVVPGNMTADAAGRLMVPDVVRVMLVPSWLLPNVEQIGAANKTTLVFESLEQDS